MIYEFKCKSGHITEESLPISSSKKMTKCKVCGEDSERIISKNTFVLKGKGWAKDGYGNGKE